MDEIDYSKLIKIIEKSVKKNYQARKNNGKLTPNVANLGAKIGEIAKLERSGEYNGIAVEFLENTKPLLTDHFVIRILKMLKNEDYTTPLELLGISTLDELQYILHTWFQHATTDYDDVFVSKKKYSAYDSG